VVFAKNLTADRQALYFLCGYFYRKVRKVLRKGAQSRVKGVYIIGPADMPAKEYTPKYLTEYTANKESSLYIKPS
jgi:hypothetical protein